MSAANAGAAVTVLLLAAAAAAAPALAGGHGEVAPRGRVTLRRRLLEINADNSAWIFPTQTTLSIGSAEASDTEISLAAMTLHTGMMIETTSGYEFGSDHDFAKVKLVLAGTKRTDCHTSTYDVPMSTVTDADGNEVPSAMALGTPLALSNAGTHFLASPFAEFKFMMGGLFQLCYAPDGTFEAADTTRANAVFHTVIKVVGVGSSCTTQNCLQLETWHCYFNYKSIVASPCTFVFEGDDARTGWTIAHASGGQSRLAWTASWASDTLDGNGLFQSEAEEACTGTDPEDVKLETVAAGTYGLDVSSGGAEMPAATADASDGFTVTACYCPNKRVGGSEACAARAAFIQQIGRLYFWTVRLCDVSVLDDACVARYGQALPHQPFRIRVSCPPGQACASGSSSNRLRMRDPSDNMAKQNWEVSQGCRTAADAASTTSLVWAGGSDASGGTRADYKDFQGSNPMHLQLSMNSAVEVCYCDSSCSVGASWLHVGRVQTVQAFAFASSTESGGGEAILEYVGKAGGLAFSGGHISEGDVLDPYDSPRYDSIVSNSLVNLISYDRLPLPGSSQVLETQLGAHLSDTPAFQTSLDAACQQEAFQAELLSGPTSRSTAAAYAATASTDRRLLPFDGPGHDETIVPLLAGALAICYCGTVTSAEGFVACEDPGTNWIFAGLLVVRGPKGTQVWNMARGLTFGLMVEGWGLQATDRLRVLGPGQDCAGDGSFDPAGNYSSLHSGCPSTDGSGCTATAAQHDLALLAVHSTSGAAAIYVTMAVVSTTHTTLTFSASIADVLRDGDVISLELDPIHVSGKVKASWTRLDAYNAHRLAGVREFLDDGNRTRLLGQRVTLVDGVDNQVTIPVGWDEDPDFTFADLQGLWARHNRASTASDLLASQPEDGLVVCWGADDGGLKYYTAAGTLNIVEPPQMAFAQVGLTTKLEGEVAPVVFAFGISENASDYAMVVEGRSLLRLALLDVGSGDGPGGGKLNVVEASDWGPFGSVPWLDPLDEVASEDARQATCGRLFLELWSNDDEGFPMPASCYFGPRYRYLATSSYYRELFILFGARNGLKHRCVSHGEAASCEYQIVINAEVGVVSQGDHLADIDMTCLDCMKPQEVIERGAAVSTLTAMTRDASDPGIGVELLDSDSDEVLTWDANAASDAVQLNLKLKGIPNPATEVHAGALLRLFLWPLTAWVLQPDEADPGGRNNCTAVCEPETNPPDLLCGPHVACEVTSVANTSSDHRNVVKLTLPSNMDDITNGMAHTVKISKLLLPRTGWFPVRLGIELTNASDEKPFYTISEEYTFKKPDVSATTGRLVVSGRTGYGPHPFVSDQENVLLVRLQIGATLWHSGDADAAKLKVVLPAGYSCASSAAMLGTELPAFSDQLFSQDDNGDGYVDHAQGILSGTTPDGAWANEDGTCSYELEDGMSLFRGSVVYVQIPVNNPSEPLSKFATENYWSTELLGKGVAALSDPLSMDPVPFISLEEEAELGNESWASNLAVLGIVEAGAQSLQPSNFTAGATHLLQFFFTPTAGLGEHGFLMIDGPEGFDFGSPCQVLDLEPRYYVAGDDGASATRRLDAVTSCVTSPWPTNSSSHNHARVQISKGMYAGVTYGFAVTVTNPLVESAGLESWQLWTQSYEGSGLEGTRDPPRFNPFEAGSWNLYRHALDTFQVVFPDAVARPSSLTGSSVRLRFLGLAAPAGTYSMRVIAPVGFEFEKDVATDVAVNFTILSDMVDGVTANFSTVPNVGHPNELLWAAVDFVSGESYGFEAMVKVPNQAPTGSSQAFSVELGYDTIGLAGRPLAGAAALPVMQSLSDCSVEVLSRVVDYKPNRLRLAFRIATFIPNGGGVVITTTSTGLEFDLPASLSSGDSPLPEGALGIVDNSHSRIIVEAGADGIPAGFYQLELNAENPEGPTPAGVWNFASYHSDVRTTSPTDPIDKDINVPGFEVTEPMQEARMLSPYGGAQGRVDRPLERNHLTFAFKLLATPTSGGNAEMLVQGPDGFVFDDYCLNQVETNISLVFAAPPSTYSVWPAAGVVSYCRGEGPRARLLVGSGFAADETYSFRIGVKHNPLRTADVNLWTIELAGEPSTPFPGFEVWTFYNPAARPVALAGSPSVANEVLPVDVQFRVHNEVPAPGGVLRLQAPELLELQSKGDGSCDAELATEATEPTTVWDPNELRCSISGEGLELELLSNRSILRWRVHHLTVQVKLPKANIAYAEAGGWQLQSFRQRPLQGINALDDVVMEGFPLVEGLPVLQISNVMNETRSSFPIQVQGSLEIAEPILHGDTFVFIAPQGLSLEHPASPGICGGFEWVTPGNFTPDAGTPLCPCNTLHGDFINDLADCALSWKSNVTGMTFSELHFFVRGVNPDKKPRLARSFWAAQHWRDGTLLAARGAGSWPLRPQLQALAVAIAGDRRAAGAVTSLRMEFEAVYPAGALHVQALSPAGFDFRSATTDGPHSIRAAVSDADKSQVLVVTEIVAGQSVSVKLNGVVLSPVGGETVFQIRTYDGPGMVYWREEAEDYHWVLPGRVSISQSRLLCKYSNDEEMYPVRFGLPPRLGELAWAELTFTLTQRVAAGETLTFASGGDSRYELLVEDFVLTRLSAPESGGEGQLVPTSVSRPLSVHSLSVSLLEGLSANATFGLRCAVVPLTVGPSTWLVVTSSGGPYETNTNDGEDLGFDPVPQARFAVMTPRSPPAAVVDVTVVVEVAADGPQQLLAPVGFIFPLGTGACGVSSNFVCTDIGAFKQRRIAELTGLAGGSPPFGEALVLRVELPEIFTEESPSWTLQSRVGNDRPESWDTIASFPLQPMPDVAVHYTALAGESGIEVVATFTVGAVAGGMRILVQAPIDYDLACEESVPGGVRKLALPGGTATCLDTPNQVATELQKRQLAVELNGTTFGVGQYAFGFRCTVPAVDPVGDDSQTTWSLIVYDAAGVLQHSAFRIPAQPIVVASVDSPVFSWTASQADQPSLVTFGLTFHKDFGNVRSLVFICPQYVVHDNRLEEDFRILSSSFPAGGLDLTHPSLIKLFVLEGGTIPAGFHRFQFRILVPSVMPEQNLWYLALCDNTACMSTQDAGVMLSFTITGFALGERSTADLMDATTDASLCSTFPAVLTWAAIGFLLLLAALQR